MADTEEEISYLALEKGTPYKAPQAPGSERLSMSWRFQSWTSLTASW
jgi:hypothetical protein